MNHIIGEMPEAAPGPTDAPRSLANASSEVLWFVSVVITCYNQAEFLGEAIRSVVRQTYREFEIIVVDDGSTDDTADIAARQPGLRYVHQANRGLSAARNLGVNESKGEYVVS